jgi:hypothetical protein
MFYVQFKSFSVGPFSTRAAAEWAARVVLIPGGKVVGA